MFKLLASTSNYLGSYHDHYFLANCFVPFWGSEKKSFVKIQHVVTPESSFTHFIITAMITFLYKCCNLCSEALKEVQKVDNIAGWLTSG